MSANDCGEMPGIRYELECLLVHENVIVHQLVSKPLPPEGLLLFPKLPEDDVPGPGINAVPELLVAPVLVVNAS